MKKEKEYWDIIESIVDLKNQIADEEKELGSILGSIFESDELEQKEKYIQTGCGLVEDMYLKLKDMGFTKEEVDIDVALS